MRANMKEIEVLVEVYDDISKVKEMLAAKEIKPGYTAPASGLYLEKIEYQLNIGK